MVQNIIKSGNKKEEKILSCNERKRPTKDQVKE